MLPQDLFIRMFGPDFRRGVIAEIAITTEAEPSSGVIVSMGISKRGEIAPNPASRNITMGPVDRAVTSSWNILSDGTTYASRTSNPA